MRPLRHQEQPKLPSSLSPKQKARARVVEVRELSWAGEALDEEDSLVGQMEEPLVANRAAMLPH